MQPVEPTGLRRGGTRSRDYKLNGSGFLAVKGDGIRVIDIALSAPDANPEPILNNHAGWAPRPEISTIRCDDMRHLRIIRHVSDFDPWFHSYILI